MELNEANSIQQEWQEIQALSSDQPERFGLNSSNEVLASEADQLVDYYQAYQEQLRDHIPAQPKTHTIAGIHPTRLSFLEQRGFDVQAWNQLARRFSWPAIELKPGRSKEACLFYNENARSGLLRERIWADYSKVQTLFDTVHRALMLNCESASQIDIFIVAGHAGPERGRCAAKLMLQQSPGSYVVTTGAQAKYMGSLKFRYTEAYATALTILQSGAGKIHRGRIFLEQESRVTSDHGAYVGRFIELIAKIRQRPLLVGAVSSSFHSMRYVTVLDKAFANNPLVKSIVPFSYLAQVPNARRVGHIVNEYAKTLYQLCYRDLKTAIER
jgi:hypothetical protein